MSTARSSILSNIGQPLDREEHQQFLQNKYRSVFLRNLPYHFRDENLRTMVSSVLGGRDHEVKLCRVKYCRQNGVNKPMQVGYALLSSKEIAQELLDKLEQNPRHGGRDIRGSWFDGKADMEVSQEGNVHYGFEANTMSPQITEEVVRDQLESIFGPLKNIYIKGHFWKPSTSQQSGFGFLTFVDESKNDEILRAASLTIGCVRYKFCHVNKNADDERKGQLSQEAANQHHVDSVYSSSSSTSDSSAPLPAASSYSSTSSIAYSVGSNQVPTSVHPVSPPNMYASPPTGYQIQPPPYESTSPPQWHPVPIPGPIPPFGHSPTMYVPQNSWQQVSPPSAYGSPPTPFTNGPPFPPMNQPQWPSFPSGIPYPANAAYPQQYPVGHECMPPFPHQYPPLFQSQQGAYTVRASGNNEIRPVMNLSSPLPYSMPNIRRRSQYILCEVVDNSDIFPSAETFTDRSHEVDPYSRMQQRPYPVPHINHQYAGAYPPQSFPSPDSLPIPGGPSDNQQSPYLAADAVSYEPNAGIASN